MEFDKSVFEEAMSVAQQFAASLGDVPREVKLTALAIFVAGTFKSPRKGLSEFRGLVDALIEYMDRPIRH